MKLKTAINLIEKGVSASITTQVWADLGAGAGLFSNALAAILPPGSTIYAVDKDATSLNSLEAPDNIVLKKIETDFSSTSFQTEKLDGLLMANSLHFVSDKSVVLLRLRNLLKATGRIILIEYDTSESNRWVPYPISYVTLQKLFKSSFSSIEKIGETKSMYGRADIYSALILP
jgi:ubiquinone/menaquinone biosynthesis C-methylase UbiE